MSALEEGYRREQGSGSGTEHGYTVEARFNCSYPKAIGKQMFDIRWSRVHYEESVIGVPTCSPWSPKIREHHLLGYAAAQALRWWLHAAAEATEECGGGLCLETRLVRHKITYSHSVEAVSMHEIVTNSHREPATAEEKEPRP